MDRLEEKKQESNSIQSRINKRKMEIFESKRVIEDLKGKLKETPDEEIQEQIDKEVEKINNMIYDEFNIHSTYVFDLELAPDNITEYTQKLKEYEQKVSDTYNAHTDEIEDLSDEIGKLEEYGKKIEDFNTKSREMEDVNNGFKENIEEYLDKYIKPYESAKERLTSLQSQLIPKEKQGLLTRILPRLTKAGRQQIALNKAIGEDKENVRYFEDRKDKRPAFDGTKLNPIQQKILQQEFLTINIGSTEEANRVFDKFKSAMVQEFKLSEQDVQELDKTAEELGLRPFSEKSRDKDRDWYKKDIDSKIYSDKKLLEKLEAERSDKLPGIESNSERYGKSAGDQLRNIREQIDFLERFKPESALEQHPMMFTQEISSLLHSADPSPINEYGNRVDSHWAKNDNRRRYKEEKRKEENNNKENVNLDSTQTKDDSTGEER